MAKSSTQECLCPGLDEYSCADSCAGKFLEVFQFDFHAVSLLPDEIFCCLDILSCDMDVVKLCAYCEGIGG
jgi:hypothetical protein